MIIGQKYSTKGTKKITLNDLLICCIAIWPFFWNVWGIFRFTSSLGAAIPLYILWAITALMVLLGKRLKVSFLFVWFLFLGVVAAESLSRPSAVIYDLSVILCGVLFCHLIIWTKAGYIVILKYLYICGFIISLSVILDNTLGIFRNGLIINLYTEQSRDVKLSLTTSGGLLPHTASAGCFIYSGLTAYIALARLERKRLKRLGFWVINLTFGIAALLIQKRGFIVDTLVAIMAIKFLQIRKEELKTIRFRRLFKRMFYLVAILLVLIFIYSKVPFVRSAFDSLLERFTASNDFDSGRTDLYELAFSLYRGHTLRGIGWGRYRINTLGIFGLPETTYSVHNVYIQLLCETGVLGLGAFLSAVLSTIIYGVKKYRKLIKEKIQGKERIIIEMGLFIQIFFLVYCMSGNPLYDYNFCITYFIGIMLTLFPLGKGMT